MIENWIFFHFYLSSLIIYCNGTVKIIFTVFLKLLKWYYCSNCITLWCPEKKLDYVICLNYLIIQSIKLILNFLILLLYVCCTVCFTFLFFRDRQIVLVFDLGGGTFDVSGKILSAIHFLFPFITLHHNTTYYTFTVLYYFISFMLHNTMSYCITW